MEWYVPIGKIAFKYKGNMDFYHEIDGVSGEIYLPLRDIFYVNLKQMAWEDCSLLFIVLEFCTIYAFLRIHQMKSCFF